MIGDLIYYDVRCASFKSADKVSPRWPYSRRKDYVNRVSEPVEGIFPGRLFSKQRKQNEAR